MRNTKEEYFFFKSCHKFNNVFSFYRSEIEVQFGGNLFKSQRNNDEASDEFEYEQSRKLIFHPFSDNRQGFSVKRRNENNPYGKGSIAFCVTGLDRPLFEAKLDLSKFM